MLKLIRRVCICSVRTKFRSHKKVKEITLHLKLCVILKLSHFSDVNECFPINPCLNNGECQNLQGSYSCICPPGFTGTNCELGKGIVAFSLAL